MKPFCLSVAAFMVCNAGPQPAAKTCSSLEIRSVEVLRERADPKDLRPPEIELSADPDSHKGKAPLAMRVTAVGPGLGSMDELNIQTELNCGPEGVKLTATITRSPQDMGNVIPQAYLWRPKIVLTVTLLKSVGVVRAVWEMKYPDGTKVKRARTQPFPEQEYPIVVTKTLHSTTK